MDRTHSDLCLRMSFSFTLVMISNVEQSQLQLQCPAVLKQGWVLAWALGCSWKTGDIAAMTAGPVFDESFPRFQGAPLPYLQVALRCNPQLCGLSTPCCCHWNTLWEAMILYRNCMLSFKKMISSVSFLPVSFSSCLWCLSLH